VQPFKLIPFPAPKIPAIEITGQIARQGNRLSICYSVTGDIETILLPEPSSLSARKHELWKATCFEFFISVRARPDYWEFNLSPSGDWNVYAMDAYRQVNMREEAAFQQLPFELKKTGEELFLALSTDLTPILPTEHPLQAGITTIIRTKDEIQTFWALAHPKPQADFHVRESFAANL
jgi:hypothetical protein